MELSRLDADCFGFGRAPFDRAIDDVGEQCGCNHFVPPTVISEILMVGKPTPTGTDCPSLPQVPTPSSSLRSDPTIETRVRSSGPLPINVAPFTGSVTLPSSIK